MPRSLADYVDKITGFGNLSISMSTDSKLWRFRRKQFKDGPHPAHVRMGKEIEITRHDIHVDDLAIMGHIARWWWKRMGRVELIFMRKIGLALPIKNKGIEKKKMREFKAEAKKLGIPFVLPLMLHAIVGSRMFQAKLLAKLKADKKSAKLIKKNGKRKHKQRQRK